MKCPECEREMEKGIVAARDAVSLTQMMTSVIWYPEKYKGKMFRKNVVQLWLDAEGYYCDECMKVFAEFKERY